MNNKQVTMNNMKTKWIAAACLLFTLAACQSDIEPNTNGQTQGLPLQLTTRADEGQTYTAGHLTLASEALETGSGT